MSSVRVPYWVLFVVDRQGTGGSEDSKMEDIPEVVGGKRQGRVRRDREDRSRVESGM